MKGLFLLSATRVYTRLGLVAARRQQLSAAWAAPLPLIRIFLRSDPASANLIAIEAAIMSATASLYRRKTGSTFRLARISCLVWEARAHADGTVTFDTLRILVGDCQPCLYLLS